jgi:hypothetical protein
MVGMAWGLLRYESAEKDFPYIARGGTPLDNVRLDQLLRDDRTRRFWLKPIGRPGVPLLENEEASWTENEIEIRFVHETSGIADGDILIAWRTGVSKLIYVAERLPQSQWTTPEESNTPEVLAQYPYLFKARNLTPEYGGAWNCFELHPFPLARHYNEHLPADEQVRLGALQHGSDRLCIPRPFAEFLIGRIAGL